MELITGQFLGTAAGGTLVTVLFTNMILAASPQWKPKVVAIPCAAIAPVLALFFLPTITAQAVVLAIVNWALIYALATGAQAGGAKLGDRAAGRREGYLAASESKVWQKSWW